jgi:hypothetical protein
MHIERQFLFRGNASGVAAHIRRPTDEMVPVQAASSVPTIGGLSESTAQGRQFQFIGFESASTSAHGEFDDPKAAVDITLRKRPRDSVPTTTTVISEVNGLRILEHVRVARLRAQMTARSESDHYHETSISPSGTVLEGLFINNVELRATLNEEFFRKHDTKEEIERAMFWGNEDARRLCLFKSAGLIYATLVERLDWVGKPPDGVKIDHNQVTIPDFGQLYLAEIFIGAGSRRMNMVRADLGSPAGGQAAAASIETNGNTWPAAR